MSDGLDPRPAHDSPSGSVPSDAELMERCAHGEVDAFAQIYDRHAATVLALSQRMLRRPSDAQDLLHDVFLEAWLAIHEYDAERGSVRTWLLVRTRSRALDRRARRERQDRVQKALVHHAEAARERVTTPPTERQVAIREALAVLEPSLREILELTYFEGMTAGEVATRMNTPDGTVKSRLARGLEILQRVLRPLEESKP